MTTRSCEGEKQGGDLDRGWGYPRRFRLEYYWGLAIVFAIYLGRGIDRRDSLFFFSKSA